MITIYMSSFMIALSGALMPGPLMTATISEGAKRGFWAGPVLIAGHGLLELVLMVLLLLGLAPLVKQESVIGIISVAGSLILFWMAFGMFRELPELVFLNEDTSSQLPSANLIMQGALMSLANPYWTVWWATIGLGYVLNAEQVGLAGTISFFSGHISADLAFYALLSYSVSKGTKLLSDKVYRALIGCCGIVLILFAAYFCYTGFLKLGF